MTDEFVHRRLQRLGAEQRRRALAMLTRGEADALDRAWSEWAHDGQRPPSDDWRTWVIMAGRGFGKTRAGAEWVLEQIDRGVPLRIALVAATLHEARRVMVEGASGLLSVGDGRIASWRPSLGLLKFKGGSEANLFSGASPDGLRGPEHHLAWCDELAKWEKAEECWDMLQLGLRLGERPRALITTTPRAGSALRRIMAAPGTVVTGGHTRANPHLPGAFVDAVEEMYGGTRLGRQELGGELLSDNPGALWKVEVLERCRVRAQAGTSQLSVSPCGPFTRVVIGVDPPSGDGTCGIVVCARDADGIAHLLADYSVTACSPEGWTRAVADAAALHAPGPDSVLIVAERNQGGKMVESVLRMAGPRLRIKLVTAVHGKTVRAEPVALLFEAGRVRVHGRFPELESELLGMIAGGAYEGPGRSPDRADAMVWALSELMVVKERGQPRVAAL
ncbi:MAG: terminase family protein [Pseudomonadota bacterium]|nr:terminase family protein [Pseudomonadota bacterium]